MMTITITMMNRILLVKITFHQSQQQQQQCQQQQQHQLSFLSIFKMHVIVKTPDTQAEYNAIVSYLQSKTLPLKVENSPQERSFGDVKKSEVDDNEISYTKATNKSERQQQQRRRH